MLDQAAPDNNQGVSQTPADPTPIHLTERERETIWLIADGKSNKLIADAMGVSEHTAKFHVRNALEKLGCTTKAEGVAVAFRKGIIQ